MSFELGFKLSKLLLSAGVYGEVQTKRLEEVKLVIVIVKQRARREVGNVPGEELG